MRRAITAWLLATTACGNDGGPMVMSGVDAPVGPTADAPFVPQGPCWPDKPRTDHGMAILGTGRDGFQSMPEELPLEYGSQDGFMLIANVRMSGFEPGDPANILDPSNPRTRIRAFFDDTNIPLNYYANCPARLAYVDNGSGYELLEEMPIVFETCWRANHLFGARIRVELELLDGSATLRAVDTKVVTARPPEGFHIVDQGTGCDHSDGT